MTQTLLELSTLNQWLWATLILYGVSYGTRNLLMGLVIIFRGGKKVQSDLGKLLDFLFYVGIIYFMVFVFKIFG